MAMDNKRGSFFGFYSPSYNDTYSEASLNIPVTSTPGLSQLSPYLNIDPSYLQTSQPEFITLDGAAQKRGRLEHSFSQIGGLCMTGAIFGGGQGLYRGVLETSNSGLAGKIRRTQVINYVMKQGGATANTLGVIATMYAGIGSLMWFLRDKKEDNYNTMGAATVTGLLYKSTSGLKMCGIGGLVGLGLSTIYVLASSRNKFHDHYSRF